MHFWNTNSSWIMAIVPFLILPSLGGKARDRTANGMESERRGEGGRLINTIITELENTSRKWHDVKILNSERALSYAMAKERLMYRHGNYDKA